MTPRLTHVLGVGRGALKAMEQNKKAMDTATAPADTSESPSRMVSKPKRASGRATAVVPSGQRSAVAAGSSGKGKQDKRTNRVRQTRIERMMSKAELARRAGLSVLTIDRVEKGLGCRMDTKRKILEALGLTLADRIRVFGEEE
jgi:DNA-binding XRE family transcriptional regulator